MFRPAHQKMDQGSDLQDKRQDLAENSTSAEGKLIPFNKIKEGLSRAAAELSAQVQKSTFVQEAQELVQDSKGLLLEPQFQRRLSLFESTHQPLELRTPLAQELEQIRRQVYVYGHGGGKNRPLGDADTSIQTRDRIHRLWEKLRQMHENFSNSPDAKTPLETLELAQTYLGQLSELAYSLSGEEQIEFFVLLFREQAAIVQAFLPLLGPNGPEDLSNFAHNFSGFSDDQTPTDEEVLAVLMRDQLASLLEDFQESSAQSKDTFRTLQAQREIEKLVSETLLLPGKVEDLSQRSLSQDFESSISSSLEALRMTSQSGPSEERIGIRLAYLSQLETHHLLSEATETIAQWITQVQQEEIKPELALEFILLAKAIGELNDHEGMPEGQARGVFVVAVETWQGLSTNEQWDLAPLLLNVGQGLLTQEYESQWELRQSLNIVANRMGDILEDPAEVEGLALSPMDRALGWLLLAELDADWQVSLANVERAYGESWEELGPLERVQLRQVHGELLVSLQEHWQDNPEAQAEIARANYALATVWQQELLQDESTDLSGEALALYQEARLQAALGLTTFCHQASLGLDDSGREVKLDSLGNQIDPEQSHAPLYLLERELRAYQEQKLVSVQPDMVAQAQAEITAKSLEVANALLEAGWPYAAVEVLEEVPSIDLSTLDDHAKEEFLEQTQLQEIRMGMAGVYAQVQTRLAEELHQLQYSQDAYQSPQIKFWQKSNLEWALNTAQLRSSETWAELAADEPTYITQGEGEVETASELGRLASGLSLLAADHTDEALHTLMGLVREEASLQDPRVVQLIEAIKPQILSMARQRVERGYQLLRAFARSKDGNPSGMGNHEHRVQASTSPMMAWVRSLPPEQLPDSFSQAMELYEREHPGDLDILRSFIEENELGPLLLSFDQLDQSEEIERAVNALVPVLELDTDYWKGDGELIHGLYYTVDQLRHHVPPQTNYAHLMAFRYKVEPQEKAGHFYRELFSEDTAILLGSCAIGGALALRAGRLAQLWVRSRVARVVFEATTTTEAITTAHLADMGISTSLRMLVLPEAANLGANATTFWLYNHATSDQTKPSHSLGATAVDLSILHFGLRPMGAWGFVEGLAGRVMMGGALMGAAGAVRVELNQFTPGLHLAHEGEEPLEFYNLLRGMAFTLGQEVMGFAMNSTGKKPPEIPLEVPRPPEMEDPALEPTKPEAREETKTESPAEERPTTEDQTTGESQDTALATRPENRPVFKLEDGRQLPPVPIEVRLVISVRKLARRALSILDSILPGSPRSSTAKPKVTALATRPDSSLPVKPAEPTSLSALASRLGRKAVARSLSILEGILAGKSFQISTQDPNVTLPAKIKVWRLFKHWLTGGPILEGVVEGTKLYDDLVDVFADMAMEGTKDPITRPDMMIRAGALGALAMVDPSLLVVYFACKVATKGEKFYPAGNKVEEILGIPGTDPENLYPSGMGSKTDYLRRLKPLVEIVRRLPVTEREQNEIFIEVCLEEFRPLPDSSGRARLETIDANVEMSRQILLDVERFYQEEAQAWRQRVRDEGLPENTTQDFIHNILLPIYYRTWHRDVWTPEKVRRLTDMAFEAWVREQKAQLSTAGPHREGASSKFAPDAKPISARRIPDLFFYRYLRGKPSEEMVDDTLREVYRALHGQRRP